MLSIDEFIENFRREIGQEISQLVQDPEIERWVNAGQSRLRFYQQKVADFTWLADATGFDLPSDFHHPEQLRVDLDSDSAVPPGSYWAGEYRFDGVVSLGGSGQLYYFADFPRISGTQDSLLPDLGDDAVASYLLYRFWKRTASSRADYRRYSTLAQANGVDISELDALSERHLADFNDARDELAELSQNPAQFYQD